MRASGPVDAVLVTCSVSTRSSQLQVAKEVIGTADKVINNGCGATKHAQLAVAAERFRKS